jgi:L-serine dehydratase
MAASALVEMLGGTPEECCEAASVALSNLLGLVCDPVRGLVEVPCQTRNTIGAVGAFTAAELALADAALAHQLADVAADGGLVLLVHLLGQGRGGALVHSRDLLVHTFSIIIIKESTQKSISRGTLFRKK